jgi:hypothetical protein
MREIEELDVEGCVAAHGGLSCFVSTYMDACMRLVAIDG